MNIPQVTAITISSMDPDELSSSNAYRESENIALDQDILAHVEGLEDKRFWRDVFGKFAPSLKVRFSRVSNGHHGKKEVLKRKHEISEEKKNVILCVDSDLDYLLKNPELQNPYIFQTYAYSIENYKCAPENLNRLVEQITDENGFDFVDFFRQYSKKVYKLLLYIIFFERKKRENIQEPKIKTKYLKRALGIPDCVFNKGVTQLSIQTITGILDIEIKKLEQVLEEKYQETVSKDKQKLFQLQTKAEEHYQTITLEELEEFFQLEEKLKKDTLEEIENLLKKEFEIECTETYWYLKGHIIEDNVVKQLLPQVIAINKDQRLKWYESQPQTQAVKDEKKQYKNGIKQLKWEALLQHNYIHCLTFDQSAPLMAKIKADIDSFMKLREEVRTS